MVFFAQRMPKPTSATELLLRAQALAGRQIGELAQALGAQLPQHAQQGKGFVGQLVEHALGADALAGDRPDFVDLQVELKTVPVGRAGRPKESTFVCTINLQGAAQAQWASSRLRRRLACVLWVPVQAATVAPLGERTFLPPVLWRPQGTVLDQLQADWEDLMGAIGAGRGADLTAYEGVALQVRPKAANSRVRAVGPSQDGACSMLPLGFYLRPSFVASVLTGERSAAAAENLRRGCCETG